MKTLRLAALVCALAVIAAPQLQAQVQFEVTPFTGATFFLADPPSQFALHRGADVPLVVTDGSYDNAWTLGVNAGLRFNDTWAVEGLFSWIPTTLSGTGGFLREWDVNAFMFGVTGLYYVPVDWRVQPFLGLGVGAERFDYQTARVESHTDWMGNVVAGLFVEVTDVWGLRFEARDCFARFDSGLQGVDDAWENDLMTTFGVSFRVPN